MQGSDRGKMRLRVGSHRIIYWYSENIDETAKDQVSEILFIDEIGNRGNIYK